MTARTPCDDIAADAMGLAALPPEAPERRRAEEHARTCAACARTLAEGGRLLAMLDTSILPAPSPAALQRASAAVLAELDDERASVGAGAVAGRLAGAVAAAVVAAWALPLALARGPIVTGGSFALSAALAALAAVASAATVRWGGQVAVAFPLLSAVTALFAGTGRALEAPVGLHCAFVEAMTAGGVGLAAWLVVRGLAARGPAAPGHVRAAPALIVAAVGGGALAGHAALHLACPAATELPHLLAFHTGPVALAVGLALLGTAAARRDPGVRESSRP
ncbi:MAG TPA: hypothetical protein VG319_02600 [Polyangia bacterium]|nr:hypothetical protein [Polyangia bacterium]